LWVARCYRGCLVFHAVRRALEWWDNLADVIGGDLVLETKKIGSANSDFVERYSGACGKTQSHARTGRVDGGDVGAWRLGFWGLVTGSEPCADAEERSETRKERERWGEDKGGENSLEVSRLGHAHTGCNMEVGPPVGRLRRGKGPPVGAGYCHMSR
jgi:hypothetical protein